MPHAPALVTAGWMLVALAAVSGPPCPGAQERAPEGPASAGSRPAAARPCLAVVGFEVGPATDPRDTWLATAIEETLAWRLRRVPGLLVVPTVRVHQARSELHDDGQSPPEWPRVVAALGSRLMLTGDCQGPPDSVVLRISLLEVDPAVRLCQQTTLPAGRLFDVLDRATAWVLEQVGNPPLAADARRLVFGPPSRSLSAVEYYARAVSAARGDRLDEARYRAEQALSYDDRYRPALSMLAQLELQGGARGFASAGARLRGVGDLARIHADPVDWAAAELGQGVLLQLSGAFDGAYTRFETSLGMSFEQDAPYGQLAAISALGDLYLTRGLPAGVPLTDDQRQRFERENLRRAAEWQEVGLDLLRELGDVVAEAPAASKLALTCERLGDQERALVWHQRTLAAAQRVGSRRHQATAWLYLGQWHQRAQRWPEALEATSRCLELAADALKPVARLALAGIYEGQSAPGEALTQYEQALEQLRRGSDLASQLACARRIAELRKQLGRQEAALTALQEAVDLAHALAHPDEAALRDKLAQWKSQPPGSWPPP